MGKTLYKTRFPAEAVIDRGFSYGVSVQFLYGACLYRMEFFMAETRWEKPRTVSNPAWNLDTYGGFSMVFRHRKTTYDNI